MATYNTPLITNQGLSLLKAEIAGNDSVTFTKIVFSSDDYSQTTDSSVQALTALSSLDLTATARSFTDVNGNLKIRGVANNENTTSAFYIKTYGLYGKNKAGNEMLIAVSTAQNANFVPAYNGKQTNQIAYTFNIAISSTNNITLSNSTDVDVTQADLAGINSAVNSNASSLTAQQSSYASSLSSAFSSNTSSMNSAFSANSSNASSYVSSASSSLQSQVSSYAGSIASNSSAISSNASLISALQSDALQMFGVVPTSDLASISKDGIYSLGGNSYADAPYSPIYGTITQVGTSYAVKTQIIISNLGEYYYRVVNSWGIEGWYRLASKDDISSLSISLSSSLASMATQASNISSSVSANSTAIANNVTNISNIQSKVNVNSTDISANATSIANLQLSAASNASAISSNATSTSSAISSVSSSNNAVSSSIASTVSVNQSNIATNSNAISSLQSSVATNSSAIASNATNISTNSSAINSLQSIVSSQSSAITYASNTAANAIDIGYNSLSFRGNWTDQKLTNVIASGIYNLGGRTFVDWINNAQIYGQLIAIVTGGVMNLTVRNNVGNMWIQTVNSWGNSGWKQIA